MIGCPYEAALALAESGDAAAVRGVIDQLQQLGARPAAALIARRVRARGIRVCGAVRGRGRAETRPASPAAKLHAVAVRLCATARSRSASSSERTVDHHIWRSFASSAR